MNSTYVWFDLIDQAVFFDNLVWLNTSQLGCRPLTSNIGGK
jgi:hypothetical protein